MGPGWGGGTVKTIRADSQKIPEGGEGEGCWAAPQFAGPTPLELPGRFRLVRPPLLLGQPPGLIPEKAESGT